MISELQPGTGTSGLVDWSRDYFAFGSDRTASGSDNDYQFTGQRKEDGTALHHFEYRELSTTLRRWLAPDPMWLATPWQSPYVYASNNPINRIDLLGLIDDYQYDIMIDGVPFMQGPDGHYYQVFTGSSRLRGQGYTPSDFYQEFVNGNSQAMAEYPQGSGGTIYDQPGYDYYNRNSGAGGGGSLLTTIERGNNILTNVFLGLSLFPEPTTSAIGLYGLTATSVAGVGIDFAQGEYVNVGISAATGILTFGAGRAIMSHTGRYVFGSQRFHSLQTGRFVATATGVAGYQTIGLMNAGALMAVPAVQDAVRVPVSAPVGPRTTYWSAP